MGNMTHVPLFLESCPPFIRLSRTAFHFQTNTSFPLTYRRKISFVVVSVLGGTCYFFMLNEKTYSVLARMFIFRKE